jgi:3-phosphoshikimate 1-carboxyvinyltransferase
MSEPGPMPLVLPGPLEAVTGAMEVPPSKSVTNRALILAAAAGGGTIRRALDCEDTRLLARALDGAGWSVVWAEDGTITMAGRRRVDGCPRLDLGNSGTGARLLLALLAATPGTWALDGTPRLRLRPMGPLVDALRRLGAVLEPDGHEALPLTIRGRRLVGGTLAIRPEVSSQFVTALALAAPTMLQGLELEVDGPLPSSPYLDLTLDALTAFGAEVTVDGDRRRWRIAPGSVAPAEVVVEGDWSAAAFPLCAAATVGGTAAVGPLRIDSRQGDRAILRILGRGGMAYETRGDTVVARGSLTAAVEADLSDCPDVFPALVATLSARAPGSELRGLGALVHKESDRLGVMIANLAALGAVFDRSGDVVRIVEPVRSATTPREAVAADDHRIAMAMAVAALAAGPVALDDGRCVAKSFPEFWARWAGLVSREVRRT